MVRADSAFFNADVVAAIRRAGARFSITARHDTAVVAAIAGIDEQAWTPIRYPEAIWDEAERRWVSDAEVAETYTAFTSRPLDRHVTARLIVRPAARVRLNAIAAQTSQALFAPEDPDGKWAIGPCFRSAMTCSTMA